MSGGSTMQVVLGSEAVMPPPQDLEPYHRLIALQKEIIRLAEENERARRNCLALLDHVTAKGLSQAAPPKTLRQKVNNAFGQLSIFPAKPNLVTLAVKERAAC